MNDKLLMDNYLMILKSTIEVYVHGTLESSNNDVKKILRDCLNNTLTSQENTYDEMVNYGWYTVSNIASKNITNTLKKVQKS